MRRFLAILAGVAVTVIVIMAIQMFGHAAQPMPPGLDTADTAVMAGLVARTPLWLKLLVIVGYFVGVCAGAWTALRIARWTPAVWVLGGLFALAGVANVVQFPHPLWMQAGSVLAPLLGAWAALHLPGWRRA